MLRSFDDLPAMLQAKHVRLALGLSTGKVYQIMNSAGFPTQHFGKRIMVTKTDFMDWLEQNKSYHNSTF